MPKQAEATNEMTAVEWDHFLRSAGGNLLHEVCDIDL